MKIHIIGGPGSGKTTLAGQLSTTFHIPHHDLDLLKFTRSYHLDKISSHPSVAASVRTYLEECGDSVEPPDAGLLLTRVKKHNVASPLTADFVLLDLTRYKDQNHRQTHLFNHVCTL